MEHCLNVHRLVVVGRFPIEQIKGKGESIKGIASFIQDGAGVRGCGGLRQVPVRGGCGVLVFEALDH